MKAQLLAPLALTLSIACDPAPPVDEASLRSFDSCTLFESGSYEGTCEFAGPVQADIFHPNCGDMRMNLRFVANNMINAYAMSPAPTPLVGITKKEIEGHSFSSEDQTSASYDGDKVCFSQFGESVSKDNGESSFGPWSACIVPSINEGLAVLDLVPTEGEEPPSGACTLTKVD